MNNNLPFKLGLPGLPLAAQYLFYRIHVLVAVHSLRYDTYLKTHLHMRERDRDCKRGEKTLGRLRTQDDMIKRRSLYWRAATSPSS